MTDYTQVLILLSVLAGFVGVVVGSLYLSIRSEAKARAKLDAEDNAWLAEEMNKPKFCLNVTIAGMLAPLTTEHIDPALEWFWRSHLRLTSRGLADRWAWDIAQGKAFRLGQVSYPHSVITKVEVVPE